ncbi:MAG: hypothetical protein PWQ55_1755 [Chloroflexota bacterium]|nr:hypothetical protein [Chloroflexota bacterium]
MKITILDGQDKAANPTWETYMQALVAQLQQNGNGVEHFVLKDMNIHTCTGCFGCWVKSPGMCTIHDDSQAINRAVIHSDFVLWASPLVMGFPSAFLKTKMDRTIPLVHPYFEVVNNEAHHMARYEQYPVFGLLLQPGPQDDAQGVDVVSQVFARTALNIKSRLAFALTTEQEVQTVVDRIENMTQEHFDFQELPRIAAALDSIPSPKNVLLVNGSPRGVKGNSPILLGKLMEGFLTQEGTRAEMLHLAKAADRKRIAERYAQADAVILGFPLYTDGMPGLVKQYIESLAPLVDNAANPAVAFVVQSGFPEAAHSRYLEPYLRILAGRLHSPYLGTLIRGGCEGVRLMPESMNRKMFKALFRLGRELGEQGGFDPKSVRALVSVEKYPKSLMPIMRVAVKTPFTQMYWNNQLKENHVYERRFDQPYRLLEGPGA